MEKNRAVAPQAVCEIKFQTTGFDPHHSLTLTLRLRLVALDASERRKPASAWGGGGGGGASMCEGGSAPCWSAYLCRPTRAGTRPAGCPTWSPGRCPSLPSWWCAASCPPRPRWTCSTCRTWWTPEGGDSEGRSFSGWLVGWQTIIFLPVNFAVQISSCLLRPLIFHQQNKFHKILKFTFRRHNMRCRQEASHPTGHMMLMQEAFFCTAAQWRFREDINLSSSRLCGCVFTY